ncbi:MAG: 3-oxoadipate enol-lactonase [Candidatus Dormiibacterota bacterium]
MSQLDMTGGDTHYQLDGPAQGPVLVLVNSLGTTIDLWESQVPALLRYFRILRYDYPGHGGSAPRPGPYSVEGLADQLLFLLDRLGIKRACFCGLSLGGMICLSIAARHPERVEQLVVACSSAQMAPGQYWLDRAASVRADGLAPLREQILERWFCPEFMSSQPATVERFREQLVAVDPESYAAGCEALATADLTGQLATIAEPTLILAGAMDQAALPLRGLELQVAIPNAALQVLSGAAHLANVEQPEAFVSAVLGQLTGGQFARGMAARRRVLGDEYVDQALGHATALTSDFQELITRYAWGEVWARPGLDQFTRRCVTLALLVAGGRWDEFEMHVRAAADDLTPGQIAEVLLQTAIYCGVPAANSAFEHAQRALAPTEAAE